MGVRVEWKIEKGWRGRGGGEGGVGGGEKWDWVAKKG